MRFCNFKFKLQSNYLLLKIVKIDLNMSWSNRDQEGKYYTVNLYINKKFYYKIIFISFNILTLFVIQVIKGTEDRFILVYMYNA